MAFLAKRGVLTNPLRVDQHEPFLNAAPFDGCGDLRGDVEKAHAGRDVEPKFFAKVFHAQSLRNRIIRHNAMVGPDTGCSLKQYNKMGRSGILTEYDRVELIRGELVAKINIGPGHASPVNRLNELLVARVGKRGLVSIQNPVTLADSVPEPDLAVCKPSADYYASAHPRPEDILLLTEVAETSLRFDREVKLPLYAEAGIQEYGIIDIVGRSVEVCRGPRKDGTFAERRLLDGDAEVSMQGLPDVTLRLSDIFGVAQP